jgi:hypothetical protein
MIQAINSSNTIKVYMTNATPAIAMNPTNKAEQTVFKEDMI